MGECSHAARKGSVAGEEGQDREFAQVVDPNQKLPGLVEQDPEVAAEVVEHPIVEQQARGQKQVGMPAGGRLGE